MVSSVLAAAGYSTAGSPSPHLHSYRERVTIDGQPIGAAELDALLEEVLAASTPGESEFGPATEFELLTAAAYLRAARCEVDVMVMEVGLGGRLDASNTWDPDVAAVTHVGLDHQEFLGHDDRVGRDREGRHHQARLPGRDRGRTASRWRWSAPARPRWGCRSASAGPCRSRAWIGTVSPSGMSAWESCACRCWAFTRRPTPRSHSASWRRWPRPAWRRVSDRAIRTGLAATRWPGRLELIEHGPAHDPARWCPQPRWHGRAGRHRRRARGLPA